MLGQPSYYPASNHIVLLHHIPKLAYHDLTFNPPCACFVCPSCAECRAVECFLVLTLQRIQELDTPDTKGKEEGYKSSHTS